MEFIESDHQQSMRSYETSIAQAKVREGVKTVYQEKVEALALEGEVAIAKYEQETERMWEEANAWERIGLARRYSLIREARTLLDQ